MYHKSARGRMVNFDELVLQNAKTIAVGNANLNARGDKIGRAGQVVETAEERSQTTSVISKSSKVSIQSEISALRAARNGWSNEGISNVSEPVAVEPEIEDVVEPKSVEAGKKARKITESE